MGTFCAVRTRAISLLCTVFVFVVFVFFLTTIKHIPFHRHTHTHTHVRADHRHRTLPLPRLLTSVKSAVNLIAESPSPMQPPRSRARDSNSIDGKKVERKPRGDAVGTAASTEDNLPGLVRLG